jgi:hypothetical protein
MINNVISWLGIAMSLALSVIAVTISWKNYRTQFLVARYTSEQLQTSVIPVPMIQDSRLTWRGDTLVMIAVRLRNVGAGPMLSIEFTEVRLGASIHPVEMASYRQQNALMPEQYLERRMRLKQPMILSSESEISIPLCYSDVMGHTYESLFGLKAKIGAGAGAITGVRYPNVGGRA